MSKRLIHIRKPTLRITSKRMKVSGGGARIDNKTGINVSRSGVNLSKRTRLGTINSRKGCAPHLIMLLTFAAPVVLLIAK